MNSGNDQGTLSQRRNKETPFSRGSWHDGQVPARKGSNKLHRGLLGKQMSEPNRKGEYLAGSGITISSWCNAKKGTPVSDTFKSAKKEATLLLTGMYGVLWLQRLLDSVLQ